MKTLFGGSAVVAAALLSSSFLLSAVPSAAEPSVSSFQQQKQSTQAAIDIKPEVAVVNEESRELASEKGAGAAAKATQPVATSVSTAAPIPVLTTNYTATAYSLYGKTASGRRVSKGLIAADPRVLPLGTRVRLEAGAYSGEYLVADTGGAVRGKRIDIWTPSGREAMRFGRRTVKLTVLAYGPVRHAVRKRTR